MRHVLEWLARNWRLKLAALGVSLLLWSVVKAEEIVSVYVRNVPVEVSLRDPAWVSARAPVPASVTLQLTGPVREVLRVAYERPRIVVPVEDVRDSVFVSGLRADWVHLSGDLSRTRVDDIVPATIRLSFHRIRPEATPPVAAQPGGQAAPAAVTPAPAGTASPVPAPPAVPSESASLPRHGTGKAPRDTTTSR